MILESSHSLRSQGEDIYGFALAKDIETAHGHRGLLGHGTLYKALSRLVAMGLLESSWEDSTVSEAAGRPRRRLYSLTGEGERVMAERPLVQLVSSTGAAFA
ncbi:PadR family transcriptional regulator [Galbitalea soli]|uniref:Helix-turn-helix transcriptional regulator n=1 Tax=Galbitalea soli TaxID=1268042 RepID=A0A7C9PMG2_9MICO|nr:PadR family transcriptional regulator [Galbitalea soli]NEM90892.1 helix-turn-helix transcriptional regulator [Galbitalea soli]NYJ31613.1 DNA-binding PadR family transcriptional regulator [Galbitalea soli]